MAKLLSGTDEKFVYTQSEPSAAWNVVHNLGKFPSVTVVDSAKDVVDGDIEYVSPNQVNLKFSAPFAGAAYLN